MANEYPFRQMIACKRGHRFKMEPNTSLPPTPPISNKDFVQQSSVQGTSTEQPANNSICNGSNESRMANNWIKVLAPPLPFPTREMSIAINRIESLDENEQLGYHGAWKTVAYYGRQELLLLPMESESKESAFDEASDDYWVACESSRQTDKFDHRRFLCSCVAASQCQIEIMSTTSSKHMGLSA